MKQIELQSNVAKCAFIIRASGLKLDNENLGELFLGYHLWHKVQSLMFAGGKKAKFTKDSPYSADLAAHALAVATAELGKFADGLEIEVSEEIKLNDEQKFYKACKGLGMSEAEMKAGWTSALAAKAAQAAETPVAVEEKVAS